MHISNIEILKEEKVQLLGLNLEVRLNFYFYVNTLLKTSKKYHALARMCNYMNRKKRRILTNAFITYRFSYYPLFVMFHSRTVNNRINKIREKALRLGYKDKTNLCFDDLLKNDKPVSVQQGNPQILATEICKVRNDLEPVKNIFHFVHKPCNLRNDSTL